MKTYFACFVTALVFVSACGGEDRESVEPTTAVTPSPELAAEGPNEGPTEGPVPSLPPESAVQELLGQLVLDQPEVAQYLHTENAANLPLTVHAVPDLAEGAAALDAGGQSVRVVPTPAEARFRFTAREDLPGPQVAVRFEIPAEGVVGRVVLELRDYEWRVIDANVAEH